MLSDFVKKIMLVAAVLIMGLFVETLWANGAGEKSGGGSSNPPESLEVLIHEGDLEELTRAAGEAYTVQSGIQVEIKSLKYTEFENVVKTKIAAGDPPDILEDTSSLSFIEDRLVKFSESDIRGAAQEELLSLFIEKNPRIIPMSLDVFGFAYNRDVFDRYGFKTPGEMSWWEFIGALRYLQEHMDFSVVGGSRGEFLTDLYLYRAFLTELDSLDPGFLEKWMNREKSFSSPEAVEAAARIIALAGFLDNKSGGSFSNIQNKFYKEKQGAVLLTHYFIYAPKASGASGFEFSLFPGTGAHENVAGLYPFYSYSVVDKGPAQVEAAKNFLSGLMRTDSMVGMSLWKAPATPEEKDLFDRISRAEYISLSDYSHPFYSKEQRELVKNLREMLKAVTGSGDPVKFAQAVEKDASRILGELKPGVRTYSDSALAAAVPKEFFRSEGVALKSSGNASDAASGAASGNTGTIGGAGRTSGSAAVSASSSREKPKDSRGPSIEVLSPQVASRGVQVESQTKELQVIGRVTDESGIFEVTVNGMPAAVGVDGSFSSKVRLAYGDNNFTVAAEDIHANRSERSFTIHRSADQAGFEIPKSTAGVFASPDGTYYALMIGVERYGDPKINRLEYPVEDARSLGNILSGYYTFEDKNISYLSNPTRQQILRKFEEMRRTLGPEDNLLIYYAGHGYWDEEMRQGYWLLADSRRDDRSNWLSNSTVTDYLRAIATRHILLISDACFSGSIFRTRSAFADADASIEKLRETPSRRAITSGNLTAVPDESVFSKYLRARLQGNREHYLYSQKLFVEFKDAVTNNSPNSQSPQYGVIQQTGDEGGDFIFVRRE